MAKEIFYRINVSVPESKYSPFVRVMSDQFMVHHDLLDKNKINFDINQRCYEFNFTFKSESKEGSDEKDRLLDICLLSGFLYGVKPSAT